jgi:hypothetical protein
MSADNAIFIKKWAGKYCVWHGFVSMWIEQKRHKPPKTARKFGELADAQNHAKIMAASYSYLEYGIIEEV